jgi:hypothetical protein
VNEIALKNHRQHIDLAFMRSIERNKPIRGRC